VIYTAYKPADTIERKSPRRGFVAIAFSVLPESARLTIIVPAMQRSTLISFNHVNISPRNTNATRKVKRVDVLLRIVFDCKHRKQGHIVG
jgi:hypothetical protein